MIYLAMENRKSFQGDCYEPQCYFLNEEDAVIWVTENPFNRELYKVEQFHDEIQIEKCSG